MKQKRLQAFSMVELSIVILIIGVLVAAIGQGFDLLQEARVKAARSVTFGSYVNKISRLSLWLETTREESFSDTYANGDQVTKWNSLSPQADRQISFVPVTAVPTYKENGINGLPTVSFVSGSGGMRTSSAITLSDLIASDQVTLFLVWNNSSVVNGSVIFTSTSNPRFNIHVPWGDGQVYFDFGNTGSAARTGAAAPVGISSTTINTPVILYFTKNQSYVEARVNGRAPYLTSAVATDTLDPSISGTPTIISGSPANVAEMIIFAKALTTRERQAVEKYLSQKYAIKLG